MEIPAETSQGKPIALPDHAALRAIAEGVEAETGDRFFSSLARNLALALRCGTLRGTLCESVLHGEVANPAELVRATSRLPLADRVGAQSCRGVPCSMSRPGFRSCRDFDDKPKQDTSARPHACARRLNSWVWAWRALV